MIVEANGVRVQLPDECARPSYIVPASLGLMVLGWNFPPTLYVQLDVTSTRALLVWVHRTPTNWHAYSSLKLDPISPGGWSYLCARLPGKLPTEPPGPANL